MLRGPAVPIEGRRWPWLACRLTCRRGVLVPGGLSAVRDYLFAVAVLRERTLA
jgi:hypothetical protein